MHDHYVGSPHLKDWKVSEKRCLLDRILGRILGIYGSERLLQVLVESCTTSAETSKSQAYCGRSARSPPIKSQEQMVDSSCNLSAISPLSKIRKSSVFFRFNSSILNM